MPRDCAEAKHAMWSCVLSSDCAAKFYAAQKDPSTALPRAELNEKLKSCVSEENGGGTEACAALRGIYFECQRQQFDMR
eukprot:CAMPEP_0172586020 /NCGR_PEP_ID=MMETSP1068-20121228/5415_1 /TAXON_ID=35684 /ORGANISM="Pseudopedinella elastica, Strain CCMP716" /LENGTH=78 /DNA_ID=CAMNT_0013380691 /DNA_START=59 /DNA_END=291 /DNA_ORIENTATION=+